METRIQEMCVKIRLVCKDNQQAQTQEHQIQTVCQTFNIILEYIDAFETLRMKNHRLCQVAETKLGEFYRVKCFQTKAMEYMHRLLPADVIAKLTNF